MQVWKDEKEKIHVLYFPTHSHKCTSSDFVHHPVSKKNDLNINEKIAWGVSPTKILCDIQKKDIPKSSSTQDIQNCKSAVLTKDCVVLYKRYNADVDIRPKKINTLPNHKELFMLGIQTKRQAQLMADHCHKILLVDETHGTNHHKYQLLTLMIIDDNRRGWPVAHLITSKSNAETLQYFFKALKANVPAGVELDINCVISDDDAALINAMDLGICGSLGKLRHILCKWHLLRALQKNLKSHVPLNMGEDMMTELRVMVNEKDEEVFKKMQSGFIAKYENSSQTKTYIEYYRKNYEVRMQKWAMCFRKFPHANIKTTGHIESFHHRLKKVYLKRKVNRRLDDLVNI
ncbi:hypothetical protein ONE63_011474 [Megalurothrips usitatus]|uniref:MULE transposase domain-containing protein n=1 Tax=Megalurothrips usitatus TaxID=439358 RepID=A0AAV7X3A5_9NEOP|nr:hypothetical protein ONE63_011474 [Megalurothrips usitatus]